MSWQVIAQPDGKLAVFSGVVGDWIATDCTPDEVEELFAEEEGRQMARSLRKVRQVIGHVQAGEARKAYYQFAMTYEEACALAESPDDEEEDEECE